MTDYKHGINTTRDSDISLEAVQAARVQVAVGTVPINLLEDPGSAVNVPILVKNREEVKKCFGINNDYEKYTLMQTALASFQKLGIAPAVMINVLDPNRPEHVTAVSGEEFTLTKGSVTVEAEGILLNSLVISDAGTQGKMNQDYIAAFDGNGNVTIAVTSDGAFKNASTLTIA